MDIGMPSLSGTDASRQIRRNDPSIKTVILSNYSDRQHVIGALDAGAQGYVIKVSAVDELITAIETILLGHTYVSPSIALMADACGRDLSKPKLSEREREVVQLLADGFSNKEVASQLYLSEQTVQTHRKKIMKKMGFDSFAAMVKFAVREGLTPM